jgi:outer membrane protein insertion porin family
MRIKYSVLIIFLIALVQSCSVKKFIPEEEFLYTGAEVEIESDTTINNKPQLKTELENVLRPKPNTKILGMRPGLYFYSE